MLRMPRGSPVDLQGGFRPRNQTEVAARVYAGPDFDLVERRRVWGGPSGRDVADDVGLVDAVGTGLQIRVCGDAVQNRRLTAWGPRQRLRSEVPGEVLPRTARSEVLIVMGSAPGQRKR